MIGGRDYSMWPVEPSMIRYPAKRRIIRTCYADNQYSLGIIRTECRSQIEDRSGLRR
ncbi:uncharacterized protein METZ01_LOCUS350098 [marine metagenome]|uniref:Uncharacterized protein n=1 Tax=marine metagenome TaxID=408172 RepID=A0A382RHQ3_9ZZZZ